MGHRLLAMGRFADWLAANGPIRFPIERAREIVWTIASPDVARMLCDVSGWSESDHAEWMADTLISTLLVDREAPGDLPRSVG